MGYPYRSFCLCTFLGPYTLVAEIISLAFLKRFLQTGSKKDITIRVTFKGLIFTIRATLRL